MLIIFHIQLPIVSELLSSSHSSLRKIISLEEGISILRESKSMQ